jgi:PAS domain S-box-containing protein
MQKPQPETITLNDILITEELSRRSRRTPNWQAEAQAMQSLARQMVQDSESMMQNLVEIALELCQAGTAGLSLPETTTDGEEIFRWNVLAGTLAQYVGGTTPRNFSPCGVCLEHGTPVLFSHPEWYFTYFQAAKTPVVEGLVLPLIADNHALGTIWIMSHDEDRHFDSEDMRVMTSLADFTATALLLKERQTSELLATNVTLESEIVERQQTEKQLSETQRRLELCLTGAKLGIWTYNVGTDEFWADDRAKQMHGHEPHEVHTFEEAGANIHPEDNDSAQAAFAQVIQDHSNLQIEYRVIWRDGSVHWIASYAEFIPTGEQEGMFYGVAQEISDRKYAEVALRESENHLRALVNASSDIVYRMSADWSVMHNLEGKQFIASTTNPNRTWLDEYIPEDEQSQVWAAIESAIQTKSNFELEHRVFREDGTIGWTFSRAIPLLNQQGDIIEWFGAASDISDRKKAEVALRESEQHLQVMIENLPGGAAFIVDRDLRYLLAEGEALSAAGFKPEDLVGKTIFEVLPPELATFYEGLYRKALGGEPFVHEHNAHGSWYVSRGTPLRLSSGEIYAVLAVSYDISERKRVEEKHKQAEQNIAIDLKDTQLLRDLSARLVNEDDIQTFYQEIMATAIALTRADGGTVQILDESTQDLVLLATQGFESNVTEHFHRVNAGSNTSCGVALRTGDKPDGMASLRTFVDFDVPESKDPDGSMRMHIEAGYLSAQSTPLLTRTGKPIGMVSTHWRKKHRPSDRELGFLDLLARQAADLIEQRQAQQIIQESEALLQKAFSTETVGVLFFSLDGRMTGANETFVRMIGYSRDELLNTVHWDVLTPPEFIDVTAHATEELAIRGETAPYEKQMIRKDGLRWWGLFAPTRLKGKGSASECVEFIIDITERKLAEKQLRRTAEIDAFRVTLSDALRSLADPGTIQETACRVLGERLGVDRAYYVEVNEAESYARVNQNYLRGDSPSLVGVFPLVDYGWTVPLLQRGETIIVADAENSDIIPEDDREAMAAVRITAHIATPLIKADALVGALCVTESQPRQWSEMDIKLVRETAERIWTEIQRARAEESLRESEIQRIQEQAARDRERQRAETLAELDRAKTVFFSNVSHEFRTPLTLLLAPLQEALSDRTHPLDPDQRERLELAHRSATRLLKLVNTLLDFFRIEADRTEVVYEPTDLAMFTTELASVFRSAIERAGLQLIVDCPPLPEPVYVDREMWEKIVLNLLSNAFKFTFEGEITVRLYSTDDNNVTLQIQDTGTGIPSAALPHLFERFYQVKGAKGRTYEGSGIGLALVYELIRL